MPYVLGAASRANLQGVHPDLVRVVQRAISISKIDFKVIEGVRSRERMMENYGKGRTAAQLIAKGIPAKYAKPAAAKVTWLADPFNSKHAIQKSGYGEAVDCLITPYDWREGPGWRLMYDAFMRPRVLKRSGSAGVGTGTKTARSGRRARPMVRTSSWFDEAA